jgi:hypothetical protein
MSKMHRILNTSTTSSFSAKTDIGAGQQGSTGTLCDTIHEKIQNVRRTLALFLHHDAITGTSKNVVTRDYERRLEEARVDVTEVTLLLFEAFLLASKASGSNNHDQTVRHQRPASPDIGMLVEHPNTIVLLRSEQCFKVTGSRYTLSVFNPLAQRRTAVVKFCVHLPKETSNSRFQLLDEKNNMGETTAVLSVGKKRKTFLHMNSSSNNGFVEKYIAEYQIEVFMEPLGLNYVQLEHSATDSSLGSGM